MSESLPPESADDERTAEASEQPGTAPVTESGAATPEADATAPDEVAGLTGNARVDEAVRSVLELGDRPVEEHVEVFEQAHSALRGALNDAAAGRTSEGSPATGPRPTPPGPRPGPR